MTGVRRQSATPTSRRSRAALAVCLLSILPGCVHRRVTVRTDPPGAQVMVGDREIGYSPASVDFTWYGTEEITLMKDGYEIESHLVKIPRPWYQVPPLDLVSDNLLPGRVKDHHRFDFKLQPRVIVPSNELIERGNAMRSEAHLGP
jgi:hypothetical protein